MIHQTNSSSVSLALLAILWLAGTLNAAETPDFARDVRPILSRCIACHGPAKQENGLRLDNARSAAKLKAIVAGQPNQSSALKRALSTDPDLRMPPPESGPPLTTQQVETLRQWIAAGAEFTPHWAFQPIASPKPPELKSSWPINPIDSFILAELQKRHLAPSPSADKPTLLRRASLDLIGLPPTSAETAQFLSDSSPNAYEKQVRRLLASPHYGERQARHWLDLARYADSNGYTIDGPRSIWPWRDWVIKALNNDMPFDRFTTEQLAGDLIPDATREQILATGFHRNTAFNEEGGTDPEQFRVERTIDRTNTTGAVWLGMTIGCAQCHDHKYDPISQRDYYALYAYFNNADEPKISVNSSAVSARVKTLNSHLAELEKQNPLARSATIPTNDEINKHRFASRNGFQPATISTASAKNARLLTTPEQAVIASGPNPAGDVYQIGIKSNLTKITALRLETLTDPALPKTGPGRAGNGNFILSKIRLLQNGQELQFASADADLEQPGYPAADAISQKPSAKGWAINPGGKTALNQPRTAVFKLSKESSLPPQSELTVELHFPDKPAGYTIGKFKISLTDASDEFLALPVEAQKIILATLAPLEPAQKQAFVDLVQLKSNKADPAAVALRDEIRKLEETTTSLAMSAPAKPRVTHIFKRGDFLQPGDPVQAGPIPLLLTNPAKSTQPNQTRLQLAEWLTSPDHPLTARVTVNREWQKFFGTGLVETENDFGLQGSLPTHPFLLDYLARRFMHEGWSLKQLHFLIVTSAAYRQSSTHRPELATADPQNRLLGRQNRLRLDAETLRDNALAVAGTLTNTIGGPPVFPPQPVELFQFTQSQRGWAVSTGPDKYRRGLYTWIWRQSRHPLLTTFDAADPQVACTRRNRSNTPIQALHLANDPVFVELAGIWADRLLSQSQTDTDTDRLHLLYQSAYSRSPRAAESARLTKLLAAERASGRNDLQSWSTIARVLMNTDEFITRE